MYKVIFADDEVHFIEGLNILVDWDALGFEVVGTSEDGENTFNLIKKLKPDVVIADINMPKLNGLELLEKCSTELEDMPEIIMLTGYDDMEYIKRAMKNGASGYLLKPLNSEEIIEHVRLALKKREKKKEKKSDFEEHIGYAAQELFSQIVYGEYNKSRIKRMKLMLGMEEYEEYVSLMVISVKNDEAIEEIRTINKVKRYSVFDMGFLLVGILTAQKTEQELYDLANMISTEIEQEYIIILPPRKPEQLTVDVKKIIEAKQNGDFTEKINNYYNSDEQKLGEIESTYDIGKIKTLIDNGKITEAVKETNEQFDQLINSGERMRRICGFVSMVSYEVYKYVRRIGMDMGDEFNEFSYKLAIAQSAIEVHDAYTQLFEKIKISEQFQKKQSDYKKILDYIEKNYTRDITLTEISNLISVKPTVVSKMIKLATGMKLSDYINKLKIEEASRMLAKTGDAIIDIANMLGYKDYSYFSNKFKGYMGVLPSQYRKRVQSKHEQFRASKDNK